MSLDPTHSEALYRRSVKKFLVDNLYTVDKIYVDFSKMYMKPTDGVGADIDKWIRFHFNGLSTRGTTATGRVAAYIFSRGDTDGVKLAEVRDKIVEYAVDLTMPDGMRRVPLYDLTWTQIGGMILTTGNESKEEHADDDTLYKFVNLYFTYAVT